MTFMSERHQIALGHGAQQANAHVTDGTWEYGPRRISPKRAAAVALGFILLIAALGLAIYSQHHAMSPARSAGPIALRLSGSGDHLVVEWNHESPEVRQASSGALELIDGSGGNVTLPLDYDSVQKGSVTYARQAQNVEVRLRLFRNGSETSESVAHFVKPLSVQGQRAELSGSTPPSPPVEPEAKTTAQAPEPVDEPARSLEPVRKATLPVTTYARIGSLPDITRVMKGPESAPQITITPVSPAAPPAAASRVLAPPVSVPARPASGRSIWTGQLRKGGLLLIDGGYASTGSLRGRIPFGPVRIAAYSAEHIDGGLLVYTRTGSGHAAEPPNARNGWNLTVYRNDPKRAGDIHVVEAPSKKNDWKLLLRSAGAVGVIVLDWHELDPAGH